MTRNRVYMFCVDGVTHRLEYYFQWHVVSFCEVKAFNSHQIKIEYLSRYPHFEEYDADIPTVEDLPAKAQVTCLQCLTVPQ